MLLQKPLWTYTTEFHRSFYNLYCFYNYYRLSDSSLKNMYKKETLNKTSN